MRRFKPKRRFEESYQNDRRGGSRREYDDSEDKRDFGDRPFKKFDKPKFKVTCDKCGARCEVPFRPTEGKPVYCSDCFSRKGDSGPRRDESRPPRNDLSEINSKLDRILRLLEDK